METVFEYAKIGFGLSLGYIIAIAIIYVLYGLIVFGFF